MIASFSFLHKHRRLLAKAVASEVKQRYAGSVVGWGWFVLNPILFLLFYATVYLVIFRIRPSGLDQASYICHILAGILPFLTFSESLAAGASSLSVNREIFKNTVFPADLVVVRSVLTCHTQLFAGILLLVTFTVFRSGPSFSLLVIPFILICQIMFLTGVSWVFSLVSLVFRDLQNIIGFLSMALMVASPIAYTSEMVPEGLKFFLWLNPMAHFILAYQTIVVLGETPTVQSMAILLCFSSVTFVAGYTIFQRLKKVIANYA